MALFNSGKWPSVLFQSVHLFQHTLISCARAEGPKGEFITGGKTEPIFTLLHSVMCWKAPEKQFEVNFSCDGFAQSSTLSVFLITLRIDKRASICTRAACSQTLYFLPDQRKEKQSNVCVQATHEPSEGSSYKQYCSGKGLPFSFLFT